MRQVAITGIAAITPAGVGSDALWAQALSGKSCTQTIDRFDASRYQCSVAGQANAFDAEQMLSPRTVKRTDRFTHLALATVAMALQDGRITIGTAPGEIQPERISVMVGNVLGGWEFAERELRKLWVSGVREVSPYQATAWFPAAPQGNICISFGIKGRARTFVADRASSAYAFIHGAEMISRGQADIVIAGGTEAPVSPYGWLCCQTSGYLTQSSRYLPATTYRPFDRDHSGTVAAEGSAFLILEELDHALSRGASIYGLVSGWALSNDGYMPCYTVEPKGQVLARTMRKSMDQAAVRPDEIDAIFASGSAVPVEDMTEVYAIQSAFDTMSRVVPVTAPKAAIGHMLGAATSADIVLALQALSHKLVPPTANLDRPAPGFDLNFVREAPLPLDRAQHSMVVSRGLGGVNACMIISAPPIA
jgi:3-oxoacyl-(acyl-carrier-protein) synthase